MGDATPLNGQQSSDRDHFILKEVRVGMGDLTKEVRGYRSEAVVASARLDEHIRSCDRRYREMRDARRGDAPGNGLVWPIIRHVLIKVFEWLIMAIVVLVVFALQHGATLPLPH